MIEFFQNLDPVWYDIGYRIVQDSLIITGIAAVIVVISRGLD